MEPISRRTAVVGAIGVAGAALVGCAAQPPASPTSSSTLTPTTPTPTVDPTPRWPLTGKPLDNPGAALHIAVAVKVPDNRNEHPQLGIDDADIVYVQLDGYPAAVGRSGTRLVPIYHSRFPEAVNPVRSIRPADVPMLAPIRPIIGNTGAYPWVLKYAKEFSDYMVSTKSYMATKGTGSYSILANRVRTYKGVTYYDRAVACHPRVLAEQTNKFADGPPQPYFPWAPTDGEVSTAVVGKPASFLSVPWMRGNTYPMSYTYSEKSGKYLRSMPWGKHVLANGKQVSCDNVLVIKAKHVFGRIYTSGRIDAKYTGHDEPIHDLIQATGTFYYAYGGQHVTGTWTKGAVDELFNFTLDDGSPLKMAPGQTFVELPNTNAKIKIKP